MGRKKELTLVAAARPQLKKQAKRDWSKEKADAFLGVLADTCNVSEACRTSGVPMTVAYRRRKMDAKFRAAWNETLAGAYSRLAEEISEIRERLVRKLQRSMAVQTAGRKSVLGNAVTVLGATLDSSVIDTTNSVDVQLIDADQWLLSAEDAALDAGANLALIGGELIQFGNVTSLGSGRFRLDRLLRGRLATDAAVSSHVAGDVFCLIETGSLQTIALPASSVETTVSAQIASGVAVSLTVSARAGPIPSPSGGTTIDAEARNSIDQILSMLRQHGLVGS